MQEKLRYPFHYLYAFLIDTTHPMSEPHHSAQEYAPCSSDSPFPPEKTLISGSFTRFIMHRNHGKSCDITGMIAFVFGVIDLRMASTEMLKSVPESTITGLAPACNTAKAVALYV